VLRGHIKRDTGDVTGSRRLQAEARADEVMGNLKLAGEKVKDAFRGRVAAAVGTSQGSLVPSCYARQEETAS
jgi:uncharacterized protein YjbJ (UPF0337 family)